MGYIRSSLPSNHPPPSITVAFVVKFSVKNALILGWNCLQSLDMKDSNVCVKLVFLLLRAKPVELVCIITFISCIYTF